MKYARITSKGQVTIPAEIRATLRVQKGDRLEFEQIGTHEFRVRAAKQPQSLFGLLNAYKKPGKSVSLEEMDEAIAAAAAKRAGVRK